MIQTVKIKNFQSHKDTTIQFSPKVNMFTGKSDSGKTAIIRAIKWAITNKPSGDAFCSNWGGITEVELVLDNGDRIVRRKGKGVNEYEFIGVNSNEPLLLKAFGTDVPDVIKDKLKFSDINLQNQLDAPFLLSDTPGAIAKHFNKIAKLENIDKSIAKVQSKIKAINQGISTNKTNIENWEEEITQFAFLDKFEEELKSLEKKETVLQLTIENKDKLQSVLTDLKRVKRRIVLFKAYIKKEKLINSLLKKQSILNDKRDKYNSLLIILDAIDDIAESSTKFNRSIKLESNIIKLLQLHKEKKIKREVHSKLSFMLKSIKINLRDKEIAKKDYKRKHKLYKDNFPSVCPLCGSNVKQI